MLSHLILNFNQNRVFKSHHFCFKPGSKITILSFFHSLYRCGKENH